MTKIYPNAILSESLITNKLKDMPRNTNVYTLPWAMQVDLEGRCWLNPEYSYEFVPSGTVQLLVRRDIMGRTCCKLLKNDFTWDKDNIPEDTYHKLIAVHKFEWG